jgi:hypothetical protein
MSPSLLSLSRPGLSSFGPKATRSGFGTGRDSAINTRSTDRSVTVRSAGEIVTSANLSTSRMTGRPTLGFGAGRRGGRSAKRAGMWGVIVVAATTRRVEGDSFSGDRLGSRRHDAWSWRQVQTAGNVITAPLLGAWGAMPDMHPRPLVSPQDGDCGRHEEDAPTDMNSERGTGLRVRRRRASPTPSFDGLEPRQRDEAAETFRRRRLAARRTRPAVAYWPRWAAGGTRPDVLAGMYL